MRRRLEEPTSELRDDQILEAFRDEGDPKDMQTGSGEETWSFVDDPRGSSLEGGEDDLCCSDGIPGESVRSDDGPVGERRESRGLSEVKKEQKREEGKFERDEDVKGRERRRTC